jgi:hypothetical protein
MFFLTLLVHARNGRPIFSIFAAASAGLSLLSETDTSLMIVGTSCPSRESRNDSRRDILSWVFRATAI